MSRPVKIYEEVTSVPTTYLRLVPHAVDGGVTLISVDRHGLRMPGGSLMVFTDQGYQVCEMVGDKAGVPLDNEGRWKEDK